MHRLLLSSTLLGIDPSKRLSLPGPPPASNTPVAYFIEEGHIMEVLEDKSSGKRIVSLFFGPNEFAVRCHPNSTLESLDDVAGNPFTHGMIWQTLRKFPESDIYYRKMREAYWKKVAVRLNGLKTLTGPQRYEELKKNQPWVLKLAEAEDIASYLGISVKILRALREKK